MLRRIHDHGNRPNRKSCLPKSSGSSPIKSSSRKPSSAWASRGGGCSGFSYALGFDKTYDAAVDSKYDYHGVPVVVDKKSALYLDGTTVDFYDGIEKRGFTFDNPNAVKTCGCGSSFQA